MHTRFFLKQKSFVFILVTILMVTVGTQSISYAQDAVPTIAASVTSPLTETTLSGSVVTLTLSGSQFNEEFYIGRALTISGIEGVTFRSWDVERVSDTVATVPLTFSGNIDTDTNLVFTVGAGAIAEYDGADLTAEVPVTAVEESLDATTESPLTEATLSGTVVTLTLSGRSFASEYNVYNALTIAGIEGASFHRYNVERISDTKVTVPLTFSGNIDADATLTLTLGADAITGYNAAFTVQIPVTAVEESLVATTETPLTETTLHGSVMTLTLDGRAFNTSGTVSVSGIDGVTASRITRVSNTQISVSLAFSGNIDADTPLTITVSAARIADYNEAITVQIPVTAVEESLVATTEAPLTETTLHGSVVTLTLSGRSFARSSSDIARVTVISGIEGVTDTVRRVSDTEATLTFGFSGNIDADATITITVGADAIVGYTQGFTIQLPVTAVVESLVATTEAPLTEATLNGSIVTLTLTGRSYVSSSYDIERALTISGIEGVAVDSWDVERVSNTMVTVPLVFSGNIDSDATITITVGAEAITGYNAAFTAQVPVTAIQESLDATTEAPLSETTLHGSVVTLTLSGRSFVSYASDIARVTVISGIEGVTGTVRRVSDTEATLTFGFSGNIDADATITITVGADAIVGYTQGFTIQLPVAAVAESLVATTEAPLTEATLNGSIVTLTLTGRSYVSSSYDIERALTISGIEGVAVDSWDVERVSNTMVTVPLVFSGNIDSDATLTITVGANVIIGYNAAFTVQVPVTAVEESLVATTETPLSEATLHGSVVTLTLSGRSFVRYASDIARVTVISGIEGVTGTVRRVSNTEATLTFGFSGNFDADATITITVGADAIVGYTKGFTVQLPVTAVAESLVASTETPLTEATLHGSVVTLTLSGRAFTGSVYDIGRALTASGVEGVTIASGSYIERVSATKVTVPLIFSGNIDTDATLTLTLDANVIIGYNEVLTVQLPVTAVEESLVATTEAPLTEATLNGSVVTLTLSGRSFVRYASDIARVTVISGIEG